MLLQSSGSFEQAFAPSPLGFEFDLSLKEKIIDNSKCSVDVHTDGPQCKSREAMGCFNHHKEFHCFGKLLLVQSSL